LVSPSANLGRIVALNGSSAPALIVLAYDAISPTAALVSGNLFVASSMAEYPIHDWNHLKIGCVTVGNSGNRPCIGSDGPKDSSKVHETMVYVNELNHGDINGKLPVDICLNIETSVNSDMALNHTQLALDISIKNFE